MSRHNPQTWRVLLALVMTLLGAAMLLAGVDTGAMLMLVGIGIGVLPMLMHP